MIIPLSVQHVEAREILSGHLKRKRQRRRRITRYRPRARKDNDLIQRIFRRRVLTEYSHGMTTPRQSITKPVGEMTHAAARPAGEETLYHRNPEHTDS